MSLPLSQNVIEAIVKGDYHDPFSILGMHSHEGSLNVHAFLPGANKVTLLEKDGSRRVCDLKCRHHEGFFGAILDRRPFCYLFRVEYDGFPLIQEDPYAFPPLRSDREIRRLMKDLYWKTQEFMGAHSCNLEGVDGMSFTLWAPHADRVSLVGDFNHWDGRRHVMRRHQDLGIWDIFLPGLGAGSNYKFEIKGADGTTLPLKADPYAREMEVPPQTASITTEESRFSWNDGEWMAKRGTLHRVQSPISIYEVHLGSWRRIPEKGHRPLTYRELADQLVDYVVEMGFTHLEVMPIHEHPFDGSWGYQPIGLFSPTSRFGKPDDFKVLVDRCHANNIGVLLDWVPGHFPADAHGLARFDGSCLYEHADPRKGYHPDWSTYIYNLGRKEVVDMLLSNALFWLQHFHLDGLRVDAVASMLYLNYSRKEGEWLPNRLGGNTNLEAVAFIKTLNTLIKTHCGDTLTIAEESTSWAGVSRATERGGLGFSFKWNMGWMNDTLEYMKLDPIFRRFHHNKLTFGLVYAFSENFLLPLSHDEVVHCKGSLISRMFGDHWQKFANLRAYFGFMWGHPGKKLLFMGGEFAQWREWGYGQSLDWHLLDQKWHLGIQKLIKTLNSLYKTIPPLHQKDGSPQGFQWIKVDAAEESIYAFMRLGDEEDGAVLVVCNFTPVVRDHYRLGVPIGGFYEELLNTDDRQYCGSGVGNGKGILAEEHLHDGFPYSVRLRIPPLATIFLLRRPRPPSVTLLKKADPAKKAKSPHPRKKPATQKP